MMVFLFVLTWNPAFRLSLGDLGDVPEFMAGLDFNSGRGALSVELGRVVSGTIADSSIPGILAEGGVGDTISNRAITTYSSILTMSLRYALLNFDGYRLYAVAGAGFQRPGVNVENPPAVGDDLTYTVGLGGDAGAGRMLKGDLWNRVRFFLELKLYLMKVPLSVDAPDYEWRNVPDWKVGMTLAF